MKLGITIDGREIFYEEYLTVAEVAKTLGKPKVWVYRRIKEGRIKTVDFAGFTVIAFKELTKMPVIIKTNRPDTLQEAIPVWDEWAVAAPKAGLTETTTNRMVPGIVTASWPPDKSSKPSPAAMADLHKKAKEAGRKELKAIDKDEELYENAGIKE